MSTIYESIREYRSQLHLTQDYVASFLGISRATYTQMELGKRKISADELAKVGSLFGVSTDELLYGNTTSQPTTMFARSFERLDEKDQEEIMNLIHFKEIMNLIHFKEMMKAQKV